MALDNGEKINVTEPRPLSLYGVNNTLKTTDMPTENIPRVSHNIDCIGQVIPDKNQNTRPVEFAYLWIVVSAECIGKIQQKSVGISKN